MDASTIQAACLDLKSFVSFVFDDCGGRPMVSNLGLCVQARLGDARRKTHQPAGAELALDEAEADALRQRLNRATLAEWRCDPRSRLGELARHLIPDGFAWIVDDTSIEKKGTKSPGVARQYSGASGKLSNCQSVVSTHFAGWTSSLPLEMELFVPRNWFEDPARCAEAGMPLELEFRAKTEIALDQIRRLNDTELAKGVILADLGYGKSGKFRRGIADLGLQYAVGIPDNLTVWRHGQGPHPPRRRSTPGRPQTRFQLGEDRPVSVKDLANELPAEAWSTVTLHKGRHKPTPRRFAAVRVRTAHNAYKGATPGDEEWLIIEWPEGDDNPSHYYLSNMPATTELSRLAEVAKLRWRVERDYQDLKQEVGLAHYEGRRWRGFNNHLTICMAAIYYLAARREFSPL